jgi:alpha-beta hydrolase superfamily lysophospholipase
LILYENGYHMLLRDLQAEVVMNDIVAWVND